MARKRIEELGEEQKKLRRARGRKAASAWISRNPDLHRTRSRNWARAHRPEIRERIAERTFRFHGRDVSRLAELRLGLESADEALAILTQHELETPGFVVVHQGRRRFEPWETPEDLARRFGHGEMRL